MLDRYSTPEFRKLWSDQTKFDTQWKVELAALRALEHFKLIPEKQCECLNEDKEIDVNRILEIERESKHETIAFLSYLEESNCPCSRWIHFGLTSSDVLDTSQALLLQQATDLLLVQLNLVLETLKTVCLKHAGTLMIGRSHGMHAEPTTLGFVLGGHYMELKRCQERLIRAKEIISVGKLAGAVGNFTYFPPEAEEFGLSLLGLKPETISTQVVARDRYAEYFSLLGLVASAIERLATTIRHCQRTEVGELAEGFSKGQKGSSAMPHKRNPILSENLCGLARVVRAAIVPAFENVALWHERDMSHSSVERYICPDVTSTLGFMLVRLNIVLKELVVNSDKMKENFDFSNGIYASQGILLELIRTGLLRQEAYVIVQRNAFECMNKKIPLIDQLLLDQELVSLLGADKIKQCCDLERIISNTKNRVKDLLHGQRKEN